MYICTGTMITDIQTALGSAQGYIFTQNITSTIITIHRYDAQGTLVKRQVSVLQTILNHL